MAIWSIVFENLLFSKRFSPLMFLFCKGYFITVGLAITCILLAKLREFGPGHTSLGSLLVDQAFLHMTHYLSGEFGSPKLQHLVLT